MEGYIIKDASNDELEATRDVGTNMTLTGHTLQTTGHISFVGESDDGTGSSTPVRNTITNSIRRRQRIGIENPMFSEFFPGTAINTAIWGAATTTMTVTQTPGSIQLNAGLSVATAVRAQLYTRQFFPQAPGAGLAFEIDAAFTQPPVIGNQCEWGAFIWPTFPGSSAADILDGAFWRIAQNGNIFAVVAFNGVEHISEPKNYEDIIGGPNVMNHYSIVIYDDSIQFFVNDIMYYRFEKTQQRPTSLTSKNLPMSFRNYNNPAVSIAQVMKIGAACVTLIDNETQKLWHHLLAGSGGMGSQGQTGFTMGSTANWANSANPTAAVPTNTTAAVGSGLGGQFWETATLALNTDGIICSYQNPAGTIAVPGKTLYIYGVWVDSYIQAALTGGPVCEQWFLAYGHTSVSLATAEAATTKAPRRQPVGVRRVNAAQAVSTKLDRIYRKFVAPIPVQPGEFVALGKKNVGTVYTAGTIGHVIGFDAVFE